MSINKTKNFKELIIAVILVLLGAILVFTNLHTDIGKRVRVTRDGEVVEELDLGEDVEREYRVEDEVNTLVIKDGVADVTYANCENQVCVNTPPIENTGEVIACLPHGLIFEVIE